MTWAVMIFMQFKDFGWKEPFKVWETKDGGYRVASELDKRVAALHELYRARDRHAPAIRPALEALADTMERYPQNHLYYAKELEKVRSSPDAIQPKGIKWSKDGIVLDTPGKVIGKAVLDQPIEGIDKSLKVYREELKKVQGEIDKVSPEISKVVKQADEITIQLYGTKDEKTNESIDIGLYEVLELERVLQDKLAAEKEYLTPVYVDAQRRVEGYRDRYQSMKKTLDRAAKVK